MSAFAEDHVKISLLDLEIAHHVVIWTAVRGRGGIRTIAQARGISPSVVQKALTRVEEAMGGEPFLETRQRRRGVLTKRGEQFHADGSHLAYLWRLSRRTPDMPGYGGWMRGESSETAQQVDGPDD